MKATYIRDIGLNQIALKPQFEWGARIGYAARGSIYVIIGCLAISAAFLGGSETPGSKGAIQSLLGEPFGKILITLLILGLVCYSAWRATQAITDTDDHGLDAKGIAVRGGLLTSSITHLLLAIWAATLLFSGNESSDSGSNYGLYSTTWGRWVLVFAGIRILGAGVAHLIKGWKAGFEKYMEIPPAHQSWMNPLCRFGLVSRGFVYLIIGGFVASSAWVARDGQVKGVGDALSWLQQQSYGGILLGVVAVGLLAFGIYSLLEALYRRIDT